jgi:NitT/TauT family transport system permease protein
MSKKATKQFTFSIVWKNLAQTGIALAFLLLVWGIAYVAEGNELLVPSVGDCLNRMGKLLADGSFWCACFQTLNRVFLAFGISFILAAIFSLISYMLPWFGGILSPIVSMLRSLPTIAVLLILLVVAGAGKAPIIVAFLSLFPMLYASMGAALSQVDGELLEMSRVYNVPMKKQILSFYLPSVAPYVLREAGAALSFSLKLVVSAEVVANTARSLGGMMLEAKNLFADIPSLFALVILAFFFGLVLEALGVLAANVVERRVK